MANPKKHHTAARRDKRRAQWKRLALPGMSKCPQCATQHVPHRICPGCGFYNGELVLTIKAKKKKGEEGQA
jgi:large subunit ribosomal protein L32